MKTFNDNAGRTWTIAINVDAIKRVMSPEVVDFYNHSDYGCALRQFWSDHMERVNKRTTVLVLGDARNNYNRSELNVLRNVRMRAKNLIWLNPESKMTWGFGDSVMDEYVPECTAALENRATRRTPRESTTARNRPGSAAVVPALTPP